jgi:hypothetical protein
MSHGGPGGTTDGDGDAHSEGSGDTGDSGALPPPELKVATVTELGLRHSRISDVGLQWVGNAFRHLLALDLSRTPVTGKPQGWHGRLGRARCFLALVSLIDSCPVASVCISTPFLNSFPHSDTRMVAPLFMHYFVLLLCCRRGPCRHRVRLHRAH